MLFFEHWKNGQFQSVLYVKTESVTQAVTMLSEKYKGIFRLIEDDEAYKSILKNEELKKGK